MQDSHFQPNVLCQLCKLTESTLSILDVSVITQSALDVCNLYFISPGVSSVVPGNITTPTGDNRY